MRSPTAAELAAIAAAYALVMRAADEPAPREASRWRLAERLAPGEDVQLVRFAARAASRWSAAGRLDG